MTQEDKELLLRDLCMRSSYRVIINDNLHNMDLQIEWINPINGIITGNNVSVPVEEVRPYLRPMSCMTEDERKYIEDKCGFTAIGPIGGNYSLVMPVVAAEWLIDFYNSHYLDWRGLIEKCLALEASKGMYNIKEKSL